MSSKHDNTTPDPAAPTQKQRWAKYGLNVALLIFSVFAIVVLLNYIAYQPGNAKRIDFTHTRRYSLSEQTLGVIKRVDRPITITTLYNKLTNADRNEVALLNRVEDLLDEYQSRSKQIVYRQIDPGVNVVEYDTFVKDILARHGDTLKASTNALRNAQKTFDAAEAFTKTQATDVGNMLTDAGNNPDVIVFIKNLSKNFSRAPEEFTRSRELIDRELKTAMPDHLGMRMNAAAVLRQFADKSLAPAIKNFEYLKADSRMSHAFQDTTLGLLPRLKAMQEQVTQALDALADAKSDAYDDLRMNVSRANSIVITADASAVGPDAAKGLPDVVALSLNQIYPGIERENLTGRVIRSAGYNGEEAITGALIRLTQRTDTTVVFLNPSQFPALSRGNPQGTYNYVADRLRKMNIAVTEWMPAGRMGPGGQPLPPGPRPTPTPGQTMVYVALPAAQNAKSGSVPTSMIIADAVRKHIEAGHPAIVIVAPSQLVAVGEPEPFIDMLKTLDVNVTADRVVLTEHTTPNGQAVVTNQLDSGNALMIGDHPVAQTASSLRGLLLQAVPVKVAAKEGVQAWPLLRSNDKTWADNEYTDLSAAKRDDGDASGPFDIAVAVDRFGTRFAVLGDPVMASDFVTTFGGAPGRGGPGLAESLGATFPANAELFVNTVYWTAGLDSLVAAGARSQEVRHLADISPGEKHAAWFVLVLGLPVLCLFSGGFVWMLRNRRPA
ncbi:MAG: hypothetical protein GC159_04595 [Phycisphaera sp.]|nr:hypothetical protein [Phycisphaera sp.]